jgi:hypothetical protein
MRDHLRESDRQEIAASHAHTPYEAMSYGLRHSSFYATVLYAGEPVAMFGVVESEENKRAGAVWLLATNGIYRMRWTFLKLSRQYLNLMMSRYPLLYNFVDERNTVTIKWLAWCGAVFDEPKPYGVQGLPFRYFTFERESALKEVCHL